MPLAERLLFIKGLAMKKKYLTFSIVSVEFAISSGVCFVVWMISSWMVDDAQAALINNRPRKCLNYRATNEVIWSRRKCCDSDLNFRFPANLFAGHGARNVSVAHLGISLPWYTLMFLRVKMSSLRIPTFLSSAKSTLPSPYSIFWPR